MYKSAISVLVAEREPSLRKKLCSHLKDAGISVLPAATARDVLVQCELYCPSAAILDARLPDMDGFELCGCLRSEPATADMPIILTTDVSDAMTRTYIAQMVDFAGGDYFVAKPFDVHVIVQLVQDVVVRNDTTLQCSVVQFPTRAVWPTSRIRSLTPGC